MYPLQKGEFMSREYQYKRYQLNLDPEDVKHMQIINYLECHKAGKNRNEALIKVILAGFGEKIDLDLPTNSPSHIKTEQRLKKMDGKLDKILWSLINQYGFKDMEYQDELEEEKKAVDECEIQEVSSPEPSITESDDKEQHNSIQQTVVTDTATADEAEISSEVDDISIPVEIMNFLGGL